MASVFKPKNSRYWTACFTSRDGRQLKRSTKCEQKSQAVEIAIEIERVERRAMQGTLTSTQLKKVLNDVSEKVTGDTLIAPTTEVYLNDWLEAAKVRLSPETAVRYGISVKLFIEEMGEKAKKPITAVIPSDIAKFVNARLKAGVAPKTAIVDLKTINVAFRQAEKYDIILKNPVPAVRPPKSVSSKRAVFTPEEIKRLVHAAPNPEWQMLILLGYYTGARLRDCVRMTWDNIRPEAGVIEYEQKKTGKSVTVPMHIHVTEHLHFLSAFGTTGFLCPKLAMKRTGGKGGLSKAFSAIMEAAKIDPMIVQGKGIRKFSRRSFHSLRHSFNSALANAGVSQEVRMQLTGHSSKEMNTNYTHLKVDALKNAVTALPLLAD